MADHIDSNLVKHLCRLSRIDIEDHEVEALVSNFKQIVTHFDELKKVDLTNMPPYSHAAGQGVAALREDEVTETLDRALFLANAPDHIGGMIRVPPILKPNT